MKKLQVTVNGTKYDVEVEMIQDDGQQVAYQQPVYQQAPVSAPAVAPRPAPTAPVAPATSASAGDADLKSPLAGLVVDIKANVGDAVKKGQPVIILEAMKMETNVNAPKDGKVKEIRVKKGDNVLFGQVMMTFE
jgi:biotin carboxyl carrier protein